MYKKNFIIFKLFYQELEFIIENGKFRFYFFTLPQNGAETNKENDNLQTA